VFRPEHSRLHVMERVTEAITTDNEILPKERSALARRPCGYCSS
jgi:hypothetical protein